MNARFVFKGNLDIRVVTLIDILSQGCTLLRVWLDNMAKARI